MNSKMKRRLFAVTGVIVIVIIVLLAVVGGSTSAKSVSVADAASGSYADQRVQVSGNVVTDSFSTKNDVLTFQIYDPDGDASKVLNVRYEGSVSATFGNDITAICTGKMTSDGVLNASELVTKCPSKYENSSNALGVAQLIGYGESVEGKIVKVAGTVQAGSLKAAGQGDRFIVVDSDDASKTMSVVYDSALSDEVKDGAKVVLTGSVEKSGKFKATDVALGK